MAGNQIVGGIANRPWDQPQGKHQSPPAAEIAGHPERCIRLHQDTGPMPRSWRIDPDDRVDTLQLGMALADERPELSVQGGEVQRPPPIVAQDQLHALGAEAAGVVVQKNRGVRLHGRPGSAQLLKVSQSSGRPDTKPRRNQLVRCSDVPWVNASGCTTCPDIR